MSDYKDTVHNLKLRAAARDARSMYTKQLFDAAIVAMGQYGIDELAKKLDMSPLQLTESAIDGDFTIEQAGQLCYLARRDFVFEARESTAVYETEDYSNGK